MRAGVRTVACAWVVAALVGCTSTYSVHVSGDLVALDQDMPGAKPGVYTGDEATTLRAASGSHLHGVPDSTNLTIGLRFKGSAKVEETSISGAAGPRFDAQLSGDHDGALEAVTVKLAPRGFEAIERTFEAPRGTPFEAKVLAVVKTR